MRGEAVGQAQYRRQLRAEQRRPRDVERYLRPVSGSLGHARNAALLAQVCLEFENVLWEVLGVPDAVKSQRFGMPGTLDTGCEALGHRLVGPYPRQIQYR